MSSISHFENFCWKDLVSDADLKLYSHYVRERRAGERPAVLLIDLDPHGL